jgi:hypothetical protein
VILSFLAHMKQVHCVRGVALVPDDTYRQGLCCEGNTYIDIYIHRGKRHDHALPQALHIHTYMQAYASMSSSHKYILDVPGVSQERTGRHSTTKLKRYISGHMDSMPIPDVLRARQESQERPCCGPLSPSACSLSRRYP